MRRIVGALALVTLTACGIKPSETLATNNAEATVDKLFTVDGCTVYRFLDGGNSKYFTRCESGSVTTTSQRTVTQRTGKTNTTRTIVEDIPTVTVP